MTDRLLAPLFGDADVSSLLTGQAGVQRMLDVEAALAEAQAALGLIPLEAAARIAEAARVDLYDLDELAKEAAPAGNLAIPLVRQLTARVASVDPDAARYVHLGATSQDILDTALVLQVRDGLPLVTRSLARASAAAAGLARTHARTLMSGRTWLQQAMPVTMGLKAAGWLDAVSRTRRGLRVSMDTACVLQFGGASGTLASLEKDGPAVAEALGARLGLRVPSTPWHAHRDRIAGLGCALGVVSGTLGKVARDVSLLAQTEVAEAFEPSGEGRGVSSAMPQKRNPVRAAVAIAAAHRTPGLVATILGAMPQEHERGLGGWQAEWETVPELIRVTAGAARATAEMLEGLVIDAGRMRAHLDETRGLAMAEMASALLARHLGKRAAHDIVERSCRRAIADRLPLADVLAEHAEVRAVVKRGEIERALAPEHAIGAAQLFIDRVLADYASAQNALD